MFEDASLTHQGNELRDANGPHMKQMTSSFHIQSLRCVSQRRCRLMLAGENGLTLCGVYLCVTVCLGHGGHVVLCTQEVVALIECD